MLTNKIGNVIPAPYLPGAGVCRNLLKLNRLDEYEQTPFAGVTQRLPNLIAKIHKE